ncbi:DNA repair protein rad52 [Blastocladiella emersonii ATCC 22665]|nr:DNA repair protein rad52 [Blastocladiella emersonii ATCC 22665]
MMAACSCSGGSGSSSPARTGAFGTVPFTEDEHMRISINLAQKLPPECISSRSGGSAGRVCYIEGWRCIELANEIFGFNGWSLTVVGTCTDFLENNGNQNDPRWSVGISCTVRVTLRDGTFREDNGYGICENMRSKGQALEKARKEASTDALKRTLRLFGNSLGNCLNDKDFMRQVASLPVQRRTITADDMYQKMSPSQQMRTTQSSVQSQAVNGPNAMVPHAQNQHQPPPHHHQQQPPPPQPAQGPGGNSAAGPSSGGGPSAGPVGNGPGNGPPAPGRNFTPGAMGPPQGAWMPGQGPPQQQQQQQQPYQQHHGPQGPSPLGPGPGVGPNRMSTMGGSGPPGFNVGPPGPPQLHQQQQQQQQQFGGGRALGSPSPASAMGPGPGQSFQAAMSGPAGNAAGPGVHGNDAKRAFPDHDGEMNKRLRA